MIIRIVLELLAGIGFFVAGVWYLRTARERCDRMRAEAQARAERAGPRWRWFFYPQWWYGTGQDLRAVRGSGVGMILFGIIFFVVAGLTAFHPHS